MRQRYVSLYLPAVDFANLLFCLSLKVLRLVPDDKDAKQTKLFLLLQTERYNDALALLGTSNESSVFERAYSSYRLQHLDEAARLLDEIKQRQEQNRGSLHLEAQLVRWMRTWMHFLSSSFGRITDKAIIRSPSTCTTSSWIPLTW